jgi:hypothetical protein
MAAHLIPIAPDLSLSTLFGSKEATRDHTLTPVCSGI